MTALTVLSNEKKQEAKDLIGGKKKATKRPALGASKTVGAGRADTGTYEEALDDSGDYDDFVRIRSPRRVGQLTTGTDFCFVSL